MQPNSPKESSELTPGAQATAIDVARSQVAKAYGGEIEPASGAQAQPTTQAHQPHATADHWERYHSAWQEYYQKYYERYYMGHLQQAQEAMTNQLQAVSQDDALDELRGTLRGEIQARVNQVKRSHHFRPIMAGLSVALLFAFLQYNQVIFANVKAYVSPGNIDPGNIIVDPAASTKVDPSLTNIVIPKINVDVPVDYNAKSDYDSQMAAMNNGLAYFGIPGASSRPGQIGNTPVAGHSSNDVFQAGDYKFIFAQLDHLQPGDTVYANYQGTRYTYTVTKKEVVQPTEVSKLAYSTDKPLLTLITCTPVGTAAQRLLVTAEQISPNPSSASAKPADTTETTAAAIPGTQPTLLERLFGRH